MTITLSAQHVQKCYGDFHALVDASLQLVEGEILALLGPNGAGKTTLIKILATLLTKDSGQVEILGCDLDRDVEAIRHRVGYVGQDTERSAYARLTVRENLLFFGTLRGMRDTEITKQVAHLAKMFEFQEPLDRPFGALSGGQKQTVVIMRALLHNPPLIFLDEPTKGLDPLVARRIRAFLKRYVREGGKSMLLTSHVLSEVEEMADRVALIQRGRIPVCDTPSVLKQALGANDFVELEKQALPPATIQRILSLDGVCGSLDRDPDWLSVGVTDPLRGAESILRILREDNVHASFRHHTVTLEDAFVHHMGVLDETFEA